MSRLGAEAGRISGAESVAVDDDLTVTLDHCPISGQKRGDESDTADHHQDDAGDVEVDALDGCIHGERQNGTDSDEKDRESDSVCHVRCRTRRPFWTNPNVRKWAVWITADGERCRHLYQGASDVFILGIILIIIGAILNIPIIYSIGVILALVGAVLWLLGSIGRAVGGRRHYW